MKCNMFAGFMMMAMMDVDGLIYASSQVHFKLTNNLVPLIDNNLIPEKLNSRTRLGSNSGYRLSKFTTKFSINNFGAKLFNELPEFVRLTNTLKSFRNACKQAIPKPVMQST